MLCFWWYDLLSSLFSPFDPYAFWSDRGGDEDGDGAVVHMRRFGAVKLHVGVAVRRGRAHTYKGAFVYKPTIGYAQKVGRGRRHSRLLSVGASLQGVFCCFRVLALGGSRVCPARSCPQWQLERGDVLVLF